LATAYGIVTECRGAILVDSAVGVGTKFSVLLPSSRGSEAVDESANPIALGDDAACVLVVEDERAVRRFIRSTLERNGFSVLEAAAGPQALDLARAHHDRIRVVVTDVNMPGMDGFELARAASVILPSVPVLFLSASEKPAVDPLNGEPEIDWLQKPFGEEEIVDGLRLILARVR
jgi:CheY-like chemotaxis protein